MANSGKQPPSVPSLGPPASEQAHRSPGGCAPDASQGKQEPLQASGVNSLYHEAFPFSCEVLSAAGVHLPLQTRADAVEVEAGGGISSAKEELCLFSTHFLSFSSSGFASALLLVSRETQGLPAAGQAR